MSRSDSQRRSSDNDVDRRERVISRRRSIATDGTVPIIRIDSDVSEPSAPELTHLPVPVPLDEVEDREDIKGQRVVVDLKSKRMNIVSTAEEQRSSPLQFRGRFMSMGTISAVTGGEINSDNVMSRLGRWSQRRASLVSREPESILRELNLYHVLRGVGSESPPAKIDFAQKRLSVIMLILACVDVALIVAALELFYAYGGAHASVVTLRVISLVMSLLQLYPVYRYHKLELWKNQKCLRECKSTSVWNSSISASFFLELFVSLLHIPPFLDWPVDRVAGAQAENVALLLTILCFSKMYTFFRYMRINSLFASQGAKFISTLTDVSESQNLSLVLRSLIVINPFIFTICFLCVVIVLASYLVFITERTGSYVQDPGVADNPLSFVNSLYLVLITFTTIGYGDVVPTRVVSRAVAVVVGTTGFFLSSLMVALISGKLSLTAEEKKYLHFLQRHTAYTKFRRTAANVIIAAWKKSRLSGKEKIHQSRRAAKAMRRFKDARREWKGIPASSRAADIVMEGLSKEMASVKNLATYCSQAMLVLCRTVSPLSVQDHVPVPDELSSLRAALGDDIAHQSGERMMRPIKSSVRRLPEVDSFTVENSGLSHLNGGENATRAKMTDEEPIEGNGTGHPKEPAHVGRKLPPQGLSAAKDDRDVSSTSSQQQCSFLTIPEERQALPTLNLSAAVAELNLCVSRMALMMERQTILLQNVVTRLNDLENNRADVYAIEDEGEL